MNPMIAKAFLHQLLQFVRDRSSNKLLAALLTGTEAALDEYIDQFLASPAGQTFLAQAKP